MKKLQMKSAENKPQYWSWDPDLMIESFTHEKVTNFSNWQNGHGMFI